MTSRPMFRGFFVLRPSIVHEIAAAYAFQRIGRDKIKRREMRQVVCPKLGMDSDDAKEMEHDLIARGILIPAGKGIYRKPD